MKEDIRKRREARIRQLTTASALVTSSDPDIHRQSSKHEDIPHFLRNQPHIMEQREQGDLRDTYGHQGLIDEQLQAHSRADDPLIIVERDPETEWNASRRKWSSQYGWEDHHDKSGHRPIIHTLRLQIVGAMLVFAIGSVLLRFPMPWTQQASQWVNTSLQQEMNLSAIASWYEETFGGSPAFIPIWKQPDSEAEAVQAGTRLLKPIEGELLQPFTISMKGVEFLPKHGVVQVVSAAKGRVVDVVRDVQAGVTVIIQHTEGLVTIYSKLAAAEVSVNDWVEAGDRIGSMSKEGTSSLYFAIKQNGQFVNPMDVMDID
ncbi:peptidoglycan DD-metalloendopeptidase family protein [Paenibacillus marinisediminis]